MYKCFLLCTSMGLSNEYSVLYSEWKSYSIGDYGSLGEHAPCMEQCS